MSPPIGDTLKIDSNDARAFYSRASLRKLEATFRVSLSDSRPRFPPFYAARNDGTNFPKLREVTVENARRMATFLASRMTQDP